MRRFLILVAVLLLAGTGYFTYDKWVKDSNLSVWSFVPGNTIMVYETREPLLTLQNLQETAIWKNLSVIPAVAAIPNDIQMLDTLAGAGNFNKFFQKNNSLITMNVTSNDAFDFLFIVEISSLSQQTYISKALGHFRDQGYKKRTREYLDFTITEVSHPKKKKSFTYIYYKNFFIGSATAFLVEDAIRTIADTERRGFSERNPELETLAKLEKDLGNMYLNLSRMGSFLEVFSVQNINLNLGKSAFLDIKANSDVINMSGFSFVDEPTHFLTNFQNSAGGTFDMAEIIPNETSWMYHLTAADPIKLGNSLNAYFQIASPEVLAKKKDLLSSIDFDVNYTYSLIDQEIGLITLESSVTRQQNRMMILEINDMGEALNFFNSLGERMAIKTEDSVYSEVFGDYLIRKLPAPDFPYALFGDIASGFDEVYYLQFRNYLVFGNHLPQLKSFTVSIENEDTWNKSIRINQFLEQTNKEANFSVFINTPRAWNQFTNSLKDRWQNHFKDYTYTYKNLEFLAFQFSSVDEKFYSNITLYQPDLPKTSIPERIDSRKSLTLTQAITTKPWLVLNHDTRAREVFIQDSTNIIYLISENFEVLWSKQLAEKINSNVVQLDYYKNGKLQLIFTTPSEVHIIDRTGVYLPEFPRSLPQKKKIAHFELIDYNNTRDYRLGIADKEGQVYLTDKNVRPLDGWNPMSFNSPLVQAPRHIRINNKDFIMVLQRNGKLWLINRRGENYDGFPIEINKEIRQAAFIHNENSYQSSTITSITADGELIEVNFEGAVLRREQLYKPSTSTNFYLMEDVTGDTYLVLRQTENQYEVLDNQGNLLFQKDYLTRKRLFHQYYQLGGGTEFVIFVDPSNSTLYIYDRQGNLVSGRPLVASQPVSMMKFENEYQIYRAAGETLELISLDF